MAHKDCKHCYYYDDEYFKYSSGAIICYLDGYLICDNKHKVCSLKDGIVYKQTIEEERIE